MIGKILTGRALALIATAFVFAGGAATVGASGGFGGAADRFTSMLQAAHITSSSSDATATPAGGAASVDASETPGADATHDAEGAAEQPPHGCTPTAIATVDTTATATDTPAATNTPAPTTTASAEDHGNGPRNGDCDTRGIPTTNPNFKPEANGTCEKGESAVKTTPSGIMVNVPCQAIDHGNKNTDETPTPADGTVTPEATPDHGNGNGNGNKGGNSGDHSQAGNHQP